jgi:glycerol-3-phosphate dehydrogenase
VVVIGGGITGVQITRELAGHGMSVLLLDKSDIGSGTSSATTKYIHGGLRYLEQGDVRTVADSVRERRHLAIAAPHLISPRRFLIPVWDWTRPGPAKLAAGLGLYELIAARKNAGVPDSARAGRIAWLSSTNARRRAPWLRPEGLKGAFTYYDMLSIHPERLLLSIVRSAVDLGADVITYAKVTRIVTEQGTLGTTVTGVEFVDQITGTTHRSSARAVVNAAGPWVDEALGDLHKRANLRVKRAKGIHLLTRALGGEDSVFSRTRAGGHIVVSPWQGMSFIGPTDTWTVDPADSCTVTEADVDLIAAGVSDISSEPLASGDLLGFTVGVRPLVEDGQEGSYDSSRRFHIHRHEASHIRGLWSVTGGKWTTGRAVGQEVAEDVISALQPREKREFDSRAVALHGVLDHAQGAELAATLSRDRAVDAETASYLVRLYGTDALGVVDAIRVDPRLGRRISPDADRRDIGAQAVFAVTNEAAQTLADVLDRRLVIGTLGRLSPEEIRTVAALIAPELGWDDTRVQLEVDTEVARRSQFDRVVARWQQSRTPIRLDGKEPHNGTAH